MAWNYRKRIKIMPGVTLNVSKGGVSTSIGPRGAKINVGKNGTYLSTGIPGTGIYSRQKISGNSSNTQTSSTQNNSDPTNNDNTGLIGCFILIIIGIVISLLSGSIIEITHNNTKMIMMIILFIAVLIAILFVLLNSSKNESYEELSAYERIINIYNEDEQKVLETSENEINTALQKLEITTDPNKRLFLQSKIDCVKYDALYNLFNRYRIDQDIENEDLDPLFKETARNIISTGEYGYSKMIDWFESPTVHERFDKITRQLKESGIIWNELDGSGYRILVHNMKALNKILNNAKGKTLLSQEERKDVISYLEERKSELLGDNNTSTFLKELPYDLMKSYRGLSDSYKLLSSCRSIWEIISEQDNNELKSSINSFVIREWNIQRASNFYFVKPSEYNYAPHFNFPKAKIDFYIYPEFVVIARNDDFDVVPLSQFEIEFKRTNFSETSSLYFIEDAKFVKYTYKYINKNGERDARYSDNPRYSVYEYGNIIFKQYGLTLQFSNSEKAENFVAEYQKFKNKTSKTTTSKEAIYNITQSLYELIMLLSKEEKLIKILDKEPGMEDIDKIKTLGMSPRLHFCALSDAINTLKAMGHTLDKQTPEALGVMIFGAKMVKNEVDINADNIDKFIELCADPIISVLKMIENSGVPSIKTPEDYLLAKLINAYDTESKNRYLKCMADFSQALASADGIISEEENAWIGKFINDEESLTDDIEEEDVPTLDNSSLIQDLDPYFEEAAYCIVASQQGSTSMIQRRFSIGYNRAGHLMDQLEQGGIVGPAIGSKPRDVLIKDEVSLKNQLLKIKSYIAGAPKSETIIKKSNSSEKNVDSKESQEPRTARKYVRRKAQNKLESLIGLEGVKADVKKLTNFIKIQQVRELKGLKTSPISYHCVFTGNPGTGKTTVARIVAEIYKELGVLQKGHLVETDRSGLVAEYVGQTAVKTNKIIDSALDGVLFIDEAYSLIQGGQSDYGKEAIATLLKRMEDDRERLVVILAGYGEEIKEFIDSNPGLQSRFNRYINFDDYNADQLLEIFKLNVAEQDYILSEEAENKLKEVLAEAVTNKDRNFGNGRFVRNLFEKTLENQATRLASEDDLDTDKLRLIEAEDL